jgi:hypothetical protein
MLAQDHASSSIKRGSKSLLGKVEPAGQTYRRSRQHRLNRSISGGFIMRGMINYVPCDICRMMGALASLAASRAATTVELEVTFCDT